MKKAFPIVDGHLDIAENVTLFGRDLTQSIDNLRLKENRSRNEVTVSLPELKKGGIAISFATVTPGFLVDDVGPNFEPRSALYSTLEEAEAQALLQIDLYQQWEKEERVRLLKSKSDLEDHLNLWQDDQIPGLVLLMEGADPIVKVSDLSKWWKRGLRMIGLTFGDTKYGIGVAGGTAEPKKGGLSEEGKLLLNKMGEIGMLWDVTHLNEEGIWEGLELKLPFVFASHANTQAITQTNRQLSDKVITEIAQREGVIGLVLYNGFLDPEWKLDKTRKITLDPYFKNHAEHIAKLVGWKHVGIGSDLDGGFGRHECPVEIDTVADLYKIGAVVPSSVKEKVLGLNWINFLRRSLP